MGEKSLRGFLSQAFLFSSLTNEFDVSSYSRKVSTFTLQLANITEYALAMTEISHFQDYRDFIQDRLARVKEKRKTLSFQLIAQKLGTTKSYLKLVIDKKRHMSLDKIIPLSKTLGLKDFETQYLVFLFMMNTSKDSNIREFFASIVSSFLRHNRISSVPETIDGIQKKDAKSVFHDWISMAILTLARSDAFKVDPLWIQSQLGGPSIAALDSIQQAVDSLVRVGLIQTNPDENKKASRFAIQHVDPFDREDHKRFHTGLQRSSQALKWKGKSPLHRPNRFQMYCLGLEQNKVDEVIKAYDEFEKKLIEIADRSEKVEKLIFLSNNVFSISEDLPPS